MSKHKKIRGFGDQTPTVWNCTYATGFALNIKSWGNKKIYGTIGGWANNLKLKIPTILLFLEE
ncbi:hypothetical protein AFK68_05605 [Hydrocoleum sp. CS-953]|nr:hypothetical protein AFK68_05605 [Hydrocoleum sp. CS-953]